MAFLAGLAALVGAGTTALMRCQCEPPGAVRDPFPRWSALREPWRDGRIRRALGFNLAWNGAVGLAASFFQVHMAQNLGLGLLAISTWCAATAVARMLASPLFGAAIDRVGCRKVLLFCGVGVAIDPALWLFANPHTLWPLALDAALGGALWAGLNQATFQLPLRIAPRRNRAFHLAAFSTAGGLAFALCSALGGALAQALPEAIAVGGHALCSYEVLFLVSAMARLLALSCAARLREEVEAPEAPPLTAARPV